MILLDSDVLLIDQRYRSDPRYPANRQAIEHAQKISIALGTTAQALLEVVGILSFNVSPTAVAALPSICLLTWNARHFHGKITIPVLTPEEWLKQQGVTP